MDATQLAQALNRQTAILEGLLPHLQRAIAVRLAEQETVRRGLALHEAAMATLEAEQQAAETLKLAEQRRADHFRTLAADYAGKAGAVLLADPPQEPAGGDDAAQARYLAERYLSAGLKLATAPR